MDRVGKSIVDHADLISRKLLVGRGHHVANVITYSSMISDWRVPVKI